MPLIRRPAVRLRDGRGAGGEQKTGRARGSSRQPQAPAPDRVLEQLDRACDELVERPGQVAADPVLELDRYSSRSAGDHRRALPERLGDDEPESLADALLDRHVGDALERVHLVAGHPHLVGEEQALRFLGRLSLDLLVDPPALRVVGRHRPDERQLERREGLAHPPPHLDDAERVLPRVESARLGAAAAGKDRRRARRRSAARGNRGSPGSSR